MFKKPLSRRKFVGTLASASGLIISGSALASTACNVIKNKPAALRKITLGKTGIKTTLLGMGTGFSGGNRSSAITRAGVAEEVIRYAWEKGIRFFDCADTYGTHPYAAKVLGGFPREKYTLTSKIWVLRGGIPEPERPDADIVIDRFRKELNTDYIDIVQLHCMMSGSWTDDQKKQMDILENLKAKGIIRAHGVSVHSFQALEAAAASSWVDVIHVRINPFGVSMDSKDPATVVAVIKKLHDSGKGVIGMKLIGNGSYRDDPDKIDEAIKFVLGLGTVDMVIVGFENQGQIDNYFERVDRAFPG
ncbi:MAG TPA: aldo/keto reductase [Bacteroidales bacterium]|nr:aldo/keto reductase [Bacteroidales bacterium]HPI68569.1 aldo/keto reductase [Bacteroidales bacterium]HPR72516.1 aldo/keto reductase [Bacteroidales bacterium]HRW85801.1 aldo/keto reductase [Bacteroidales bacterium]